LTVPGEAADVFPLDQRQSTLDPLGEQVRDRVARSAAPSSSTTVNDTKKVPALR